MRGTMRTPEPVSRTWSRPPNHPPGEWWHSLINKLKTGTCLVNVLVPSSQLAAVVLLTSPATARWQPRSSRLAAEGRVVRRGREMVRCRHVFAQQTFIPGRPPLLRSFRHGCRVDHVLPADEAAGRDHRPNLPAPNLGVHQRECRQPPDPTGFVSAPPPEPRSHLYQPCTHPIPHPIRSNAPGSRYRQHGARFSGDSDSHGCSFVHTARRNPCHVLCSFVCLRVALCGPEQQRRLRSGRCLLSHPGSCRFARAVCPPRVAGSVDQ